MSNDQYIRKENAISIIRILADKMADVIAN